MNDYESRRVLAVSYIPGLQRLKVERENRSGRLLYLKKLLTGNLVSDNSKLIQLEAAANCCH